jgi:signal transduction histidine kinase
VIGVLTLAYRRDGRRFGESEVVVLEQFARLAAIAIENARLYTQAREAVRVRDEFLSIAAHELKTPITSLRGTAQLLLRTLEKSGTVDAQRLRGRLAAINQQSGKIGRLVNQLLDVSRLDAGKLTLDRAPTDLPGLVRGVAEAAEALSDRHAIAVRAEGAAIATVDPIRLEQVLTNLVDNAIKYSPDGGPIEIALTRPSPGEVAISVTDRGLGIPPEHRSRIFDRFFQAHAGNHYSGMGLGLYVSRQIVELHGGTLEADFPAEGGTRFVVRLPVGTAPSTEARQSEVARD